MKVMFTGATGVVGRVAIPLLVGGGHDVIGVVRAQDGGDWLQSVGARPARIDLLDEGEVTTTMRGIDVVVHFATAIPSLVDMVKPGSWVANDALRDQGTSILVDSALAGGVGRFIQESITFFYADGGSEWLDETSPIDLSFRPLASALAAEGHVDRFRQGGGVGVSLRLARLYGPGEASREYVEAIEKRDIPVVGRGTNYVSSLHIEDAASALVTALTAPDGLFNVVDDEPVRSALYIDTLADVLAAPRPRRLPKSAVKLALGRSSGLLVSSQRVSNRKFRDTTGWEPRYASVVDGWQTVVAGAD